MYNNKILVVKQLFKTQVLETLRRSFDLNDLKIYVKY